MKGFTLIELLIVIAIVAILAVVVILVLNPSELLKQARDSSRVSDLNTLRHAVLLSMQDSPNNSIASSSFGYGSCYVSTIAGNGTTSLKCGVFTNTYTSVVSGTVATYRKNDSTGWVPVNFHLSIGIPIGSLPVDPINNVQYYYAYAASVASGKYFEFDAFIESKKYGYGGTGDIVSTDGGSSTSTLELGNAPGLNL